MADVCLEWALGSDHEEQTVASRGHGHLVVQFGVEV